MSKKEAMPKAAVQHVSDQVRSQGLNFESISVHTEDGYTNELWHVWNNDTKRDDLLPLYFQHGLIDTAGTWFFNTPDKAPAYLLA